MPDKKPGGGPPPRQTGTMQKGQAQKGGTEAKPVTPTGKAANQPKKK